MDRASGGEDRLTGGSEGGQEMKVGGRDVVEK
jgi:hypothetical protein